MEIDELISREVVERPRILDVGQNHFLAQAGFDQLDDILNTGREAGRRLGQAIGGRHRQDQAGHQKDNCRATPRFNQASGSHYVSRTQKKHSHTIHLHNLPHF
jgi:hypothetical protein